MSTLPDWVLQLVYELRRAEDEHPMFYRLTSAVTYQPTDCYLRELLELVPTDVLTGVEIAAMWTPIGYCRECGRKLRYHDPSTCAAGHGDPGTDTKGPRG